MPTVCKMKGTSKQTKWIGLFLVAMLNTFPHFSNAKWHEKPKQFQSVRYGFCGLCTNMIIMVNVNTMPPKIIWENAFWHNIFIIFPVVFSKLCVEGSPMKCNTKLAAMMFEQGKFKSNKTLWINSLPVPMIAKTMLSSANERECNGERESE